jgi:hypothetical protein
MREIIATRRLVLRSPLPSDLPVLYEHVFSDVAVMSYAFTGQPFSLQQTADFFEESFDHEATSIATEPH